MKQELVVKSNILLQHPLYKTSLELKIFSRIVLAIRKEPKEEVFTFQIKELIEDLKCHEDEYSRLKKIAKNMSGKTVDINVSSENICDIVVIFRRITINKRGVITFKIEEDIKPFILNLTSNFTQYYFENIARLKSSFSIRIYELLKQYEKIGSRKISVMSLRHFLNISDEKYKLYGDFKKKTILVAQKELKEKTDIYFDFQEVKQGNKIVEIIFIILHNKNIDSVNKIEVIDDLTEAQKELTFKLINQFKISEKIANDLVKTIKAEQIENNINYAEKEYKNGKITKSFGGYLLDAIKNNYAGNISIFEIEQKQRKVTEEKTKRIDGEREKLEFKLSKDFGIKIRADFIASLSEEEINDLTNEIIEKVKTDKYTIDQIRRKGIIKCSSNLHFS